MSLKITLRNGRTVPRALLIGVYSGEHLECPENGAVIELATAQRYPGCDGCEYTSSRGCANDSPASQVREHYGLSATNRHGDLGRYRHLQHLCQTDVPLVIYLAEIQEMS